MQLARLLWDVGQTASTGVCLVALPGGAPDEAARVELFRGWVHAVDAQPVRKQLPDGKVPPRGEDALMALLRLDAVTCHLDEKLPREKRGACPPFHPAQLVRNALDARRREIDWPGWSARLGLGTVQLSARPHASCLGSDEKPLIAFLAAARTIDEIEAARFCTPLRAARLLHFLDTVGCLTVVPRVTSAFTVLGLADGAPVEEVRRAFKRLAYELHPDRHPQASDEDRRALERKFAEVNAAYRQLV